MSDDQHTLQELQMSNKFLPQQLLQQLQQNPNFLALFQQQQQHQNMQQQQQKQQQLQQLINQQIIGQQQQQQLGIPLAQLNQLNQQQLIQQIAKIGLGNNVQPQILPNDRNQILMYQLQQSQQKLNQQQQQPQFQNAATNQLYPNLIQQQQQQQLYQQQGVNNSLNAANIGFDRNALVADLQQQYVAQQQQLLLQQIQQQKQQQQQQQQAQHHQLQSPDISDSQNMMLLDQRFQQIPQQNRQAMLINDLLNNTNSVQKQPFQQIAALGLTQNLIQQQKIVLDDEQADEEQQYSLNQQDLELQQKSRILKNQFQLANLGRENQVINLEDNSDVVYESGIQAAQKQKLQQQQQQEYILQQQMQQQQNIGAQFSQNQYLQMIIQKINEDPSILQKNPTLQNVIANILSSQLKGGDMNDQRMKELFMVLGQNGLIALDQVKVEDVNSRNYNSVNQTKKVGNQNDSHSVSMSESPTKKRPKKSDDFKSTMIQEQDIQVIDDDDDEPIQPQKQQSNQSNGTQNSKNKPQQDSVKRNEDLLMQVLNNNTKGKQDTKKNNKAQSELVINEASNEDQNNKEGENLEIEEQEKDEANKNNEIIEENEEDEEGDDEEDEEEDEGKNKKLQKGQKSTANRKKGNKKDKNDGYLSNEEEDNEKSDAKSKAGDKKNKKSSNNNNLNNSNSKSANNSSNTTQSKQNQNQVVPKVCSNNFCKKAPINLQKANSKSTEGKFYWFCQQCFECFNKGYHCDYCEQVYENNESCADVKEWVGCESCSKWNHVDCEAAFRNDAKIKKIYKSKDFKYYCQKCDQKKNKKQNNPSNNSPQVNNVQGNGATGSSTNIGSVQNIQVNSSNQNQNNSTNQSQGKKTRNRLNNSNQIGSQTQWDEPENKQSTKKVTPSKRRQAALGNASTSQVPSDNEKMSTHTGDFKQKNNDQYKEYQYDISQPYKKRIESKFQPKEQSQEILPSRKKYTHQYPHHNFNYFQYFINELAFGVKLILSDDFIKSDLDKFRCCIDEEFKEKYEEEQRIRELNRKKKEEAEQERIKLSQQRKLQHQQKMKERQQNNEEEDDDNEDQDSENRNDNDDDGAEGDDSNGEDDDGNNNQQNSSNNRNQITTRRANTRRAQALAEQEKNGDEDKDDETHNSNQKGRNRRNADEKRSKFGQKQKAPSNEDEEGKDENDNKSENNNDWEGSNHGDYQKTRTRKRANLNKRSMFHQQPSTNNIDDDQNTDVKLRSGTQMDIEDEQEENNDDENNNNNDEFNSDDDQNEDDQDKKNTRGKSTVNQRNTRSKTGNHPPGYNNFNSYRTKLRVTPEKNKLRNGSSNTNNSNSASNQNQSSATTTTRSGRTAGNKY
ncbi:hypothetical protein TTHERM_00666310 (macronuclear) [Tetrahymena thermophila SB210]|uniref:PHD-finger protein n=1 Tax=Tetrahymena thermophila (strain SB210) TaxID=312017 RepID=Q23TF1_TETTS|nr:hypothetical protein TTHERM_00666310 [Tetrahymena thermophila SB210]EAR99755.2 hypothetical protein TTHERM_00666310 [Tetrahymena thermophila SB210]|eukprot:XP_001020000.2 hypothetical protein TTHERM_00666310 [Tetrahymena thermophila SB210]